MDKLIYFGRRALNLLLSTDHPRRMLVTMALLSMTLMVSSAAVILYLEHAGVIDTGGVAAWWALASVGGLLAMTALIRSGWTARWSDPALTIPQMGWTITSAAIAYVFLGDARGIVPSVLAMILFFGALGLNLGQVIGIGLFAIGAFAFAVLASSGPATNQYAPIEIAYALMIMIVLTGCMVLNVRIHDIRQRSSSKGKALSEALQQNRELALRDDLTGLLNRRAMLELLELEQKRHQRRHGNLVLVMLDLDHFKPINDQYGHATGDRALQGFAAAALSVLRDVDMLARWGGDEFLLMLSDTTLEQAELLLERLRIAVAALELTEVREPLGLTLSGGMALNLLNEPVEDTLHRADAALYRAKAQGRNRIAGRLASELDDPALSLARVQAKS